MTSKMTAKRWKSVPGEVFLGLHVDPRTYAQTAISLRLSRERHFHTAFCGDTGYGKTVAAERLVYETTVVWGLKSIVLDWFGHGWRKLANAPHLRGRVTVHQLNPNGPRPLRWNPLQVGCRIEPMVHLNAFCDVFGQVHGLATMQLHELRNTLSLAYRAAGVFVDDPALLRDTAWAAVTDAEAADLDLAAGTAIGDLSLDDRQRVAVRRSQAVGLEDLVAILDEQIGNMRTQPAGEALLLLDNLRNCFSFLVEGAPATQYGAGSDAIDITEIVPDAGHVAILEGGAFLEPSSKAFLFAWSAWQIYIDAVIRRREHEHTTSADTQIVFENANRILGNPDGQALLDEPLLGMWRDSRKHGIWLHLTTQTPSAIPPGILSSCHNVFYFQTKNRRDQATARTGLQDDFSDALAMLPKGVSLARLGYTFKREDMQPALIAPWPLDATVPTDRELAAL